MLSRPLSHTLGFLRLPLILGVVMIHCIFISDIEPLAPSQLLFGEIIKIFHAMVLSLCVPTFFVISGMLFFRHGPTLSLTDYTGKLKSRVRTLLIPYFLWNLIGLGVLLLKKWCFTSEFPVDANFALTPWNVAKVFFSMPNTHSPYDFPLWFIRNLIIIVIASPVFAALFRIFRAYSLGIYYVSLIVIDTYVPELSGLGLFNNSFYFFSGAWLINYSPRLLNVFTPLPAAAAYTILYISAVHTESEVITTGLLSMATLTGCVAVIHAGNYFTARGVVFPAGLTKAAFFIYASHGLYSSIVRKMVCRCIAPVNNTLCFIDYIVSFIVLVSISYFLYLIAMRAAPCLTQILSRGRNRAEAV